MSSYIIKYSLKNKINHLPPQPLSGLGRSTLAVLDSVLLITGGLGIHVWSRLALDENSLTFYAHPPEIKLLHIPT